jgi:hypothetical protein
MRAYRILAIILLLTVATAGSVPFQVIAAPGLRPSVTLTDDLLAYWTLDEASSTRFDSLVGCGGGGCNLTDNNTVTQAAGMLTNAAKFTSANSEWLSHVDDATLSAGNTNFTIAAWAYMDTKITSGIFGKYPFGGQNEYLVLYTAASDRFQFYYCSDGSTCTNITASSLGSPSVATWYYIVIWHDATNNLVGIEVNGLRNIQSYSGGVNDGTAAFEIGRYGGSNYFDGRIDSVGFWRRVLTDSERTWLYNAGAGCEYPFTGCEPTPTPTIATATPTATATPLFSYPITLSSGNQVQVLREISYGEIAVTGALMALFLLALVYIVHRVVSQWLFR